MAELLKAVVPASWSFDVCGYSQSIVTKLHRIWLCWLNAVWCMILWCTGRKAEAETLLFPSVTENVLRKEKGYIEGFATESWPYLVLSNLLCLSQILICPYGMVHYKSFRL